MFRNILNLLVYNIVGIVFRLKLEKGSGGGGGSEVAAGVFRVQNKQLARNGKGSVASAICAIIYHRNESEAETASVASKAGLGGVSIHSCFSAVMAKVGVAIGQDCLQNRISRAKPC